MFCSNCGCHMVEPLPNFCHSCGHSVVPTASGTSTASGTTISAPVLSYENFLNVRKQKEVERQPFSNQKKQMKVMLRNVKIKEASTDDDYKDAINNIEDTIMLAGCSALSYSLENREQLLKALCHFLAIGRSTMAIEQFKNGLKTLDVLDAVQQHPEVMRAAFVYIEQPLDATSVEELFSINWSVNGSNRFRVEKTAITHWRDFLQDAEADGILGKLLVFVTGLNSPPPLGFEHQPSITFAHDELEATRMFPVANTCSCTLRLPLLESYDQFKDNMVAAMDMCCTFSMH